VNPCNAAGVVFERVERFKKAGDVDALVSVLRRGWWIERALAAITLGDLRGARVVDALLGALRDRSYLVRVAAGQTLARVDPQIDGARVLASIREPTDDPERPPTAEELVWSGAAPIPTLNAPEILVGALGSADAFDRAKYIHHLGTLGDRTVAPALVPYLDDEDASVRQAAEHALTAFRESGKHSSVS
jgi:HEAT repeat protein